MYASGGRGGGFGGPRGTHQSGGDGSSRGGGSRRGRGKGRAPQPKMRVACTTEVAVPEQIRGLIIGKGGATVHSDYNRVMSHFESVDQGVAATHGG